MIFRSYRRSQSAPGLMFPWLAANGQTIDFSSGFTFEAVLIARRNGMVIENAGRVTGTVGGVLWDPEDAVEDGHAATLDLPEGTTYNLIITAIEDTSGRRRVLRPKNPPRIRIEP